MNSSLSALATIVASDDKFRLSNFIKRRKVCESFRDLFQVKKETTSIQVTVTEMHKGGMKY